MPKYLIHRYGSAIALGVETFDQTEMDYAFNSFFNFGAVVNGETHKLTDSFSYVWTTPKRFNKYLELSSLFKILGGDTSTYRKQKGGAMPAARKLAEIRRAEFEDVPFLAEPKSISFETYEINHTEMLKNFCDVES